MNIIMELTTIETFNYYVRKLSAPTTYEGLKF